MKTLLILLLMTSCTCPEEKKGDSGAIEYQSQIDYTEEQHIKKLKDE